MKSILKSFLKAVFGASINLASSLVKQKIIAVFLGPQGIAIISILNQFQNAVLPIAGLGSDKTIAQGIASRIDSERRAFLESTTAVLLVTWTLSFCFMLAFGNLLGIFVFGKSEGNLEGIICWMAIPFVGAAVLQYFQGILMGVGAIGSVQKAQIVGTVIGIATAWAVGSNRNLLGASGYLIYMSVPVIASLAASIWYNLRLNSTSAIFKGFSLANRRWGLGKEFFLFSSILVLTGLVNGWVWLIIRKLVFQHYGQMFLGFFSATVSVSGMVVTLMSVALSGYYLPKYASSDKQERKRLALITFALLAACAASYVIIIQLFASEVIHLIFSREFAPMIPLLKIWVFGDFIRLLSYVFSVTMLSLALKRIYVVTEILTNISSLILFQLGISHFGLAFEDLGYLHISIYVIYSIQCILFFTKSNVFRTASGN